MNADSKDTKQQYGEGNYKAAREYNSGLKEHIENNDTEKEAHDAAPRNADEERAMEEAERIGKSRARGEDGKDDNAASPDSPDSR